MDVIDGERVPFLGDHDHIGPFEKRGSIEPEPHFDKPGAIGTLPFLDDFEKFLRSVTVIGPETVWPLL
jgi:hypothetical protein